MQAAPSQRVVLIDYTPTLCYSDQSCDFRCCDYPGKEYVDQGTCAEIESVTRCEDRKHVDNIVLWCILSCLLVVIGFCVVMKKKERTRDKQALINIKLFNA